MSIAGQDITQLLAAWREGEPSAFERLLPEVLGELRLLAKHYLAGERGGHTLQPTALVNEVYLRLSGHCVQAFSSRSEFFAFTARLMREILVDHARAKARRKRGGHLHRVGLEQALESPVERMEEETVLAIDEAMSRLGQASSRRRQVVELRYFVGLTIPEIAQAMGLGHATVERDLAVARRWLAREMKGSPEA